MTAIEQRTISKVTRRLVPFLIVCYFIAYLDRVNVGFAALTMNKDLNFSQTIFGFGSGIFFIAYFFFEVPSNLALDRFGARRWIARIMFTWGLLSGAMAFIKTDTHFYIVRALLGVAEAGFFPGIIFFLTLWFPARYRARIIGWFMFAIPISSVIGAPVSGLIIGLDGIGGLQGWQWLFVMEAAPALLLSFAVYFYLTDRPKDAAWLEADEQQWLQNCLDAEERQRRSRSNLDLWPTLGSARVWALAFVYFGVVAANYGLGFFLPQIVKGFGLSNAQTGLVTAIPYAIGAVGMVLWGMRSDRNAERKWHTVIPAGFAALGLALSAMTDDPTMKMLALSIAGFGIFAALSMFWTLPTAYLSGRAAAAGIALMNSVGNLSGFLGPYMMGYMKDWTGEYTIGLYILSGCALMSVAILLALGHDHALEKVAPAA